MMMTMMMMTMMMMMMMMMMNTTRRLHNAPPLPCRTHWASRVEVIGGYHEYVDVKSCQDVVHLYHLLWSATILNIVALFLGIITAAVLGGFKDMVT